MGTRRWGERLHGGPGPALGGQADGRTGRPAVPAEGAELGPGGAEEGELR